MLAPDEIGLVAAHLDAVGTCPTRSGCRATATGSRGNWLVDRTGEPWAFDFEHARIGPWFEDVLRLWWDEWQAAPALADAFFDGYGRRPDAAERRWLAATSALWHLTTIVWADEHDDAVFVDRVAPGSTRCVSTEAATGRAATDLVRRRRRRGRRGGPSAQQSGKCTASVGGHEAHVGRGGDLGGVHHASSYTYSAFRCSQLTPGTGVERSATRHRRKRSCWPS